MITIGSTVTYIGSLYSELKNVRVEVVDGPTRAGGDRFWTVRTKDSESYVVSESHLIVHRESTPNPNAFVLSTRVGSSGLGAPKGGNCTGCNLYNNMQDGPYTCRSCND